MGRALVMDDLQRMTITADLSTCLFARHVGDIFIMKKDKAAADKIFNKFNEQRGKIKLTIEHPSRNIEFRLYLRESNYYILFTLTFPFFVPLASSFKG